MRDDLERWLQAAADRPGGDILAVQTLRNALMAASVLLSTALVALMGVLATAHLHSRNISLVAAALLVLSTAFALHAAARLSAAGFTVQFNPPGFAQLAGAVHTALRNVRVSAALLALGLAVAASGLLFAG
jgi:Protein of unknown function, DUF599